MLIKSFNKGIGKSWGESQEASWEGGNFKGTHPNRMEIFMLLLRNGINKIHINELKTKVCIQIYLRLSGPKWYPIQFSSVQSLSHVRPFVTPWIATCQPSLSITNSRNLHKLKYIESVMPSSHLILCHPFSSFPQSLPASGSFPMSQIKVSSPLTSKCPKQICSIYPNLEKIKRQKRVIQKYLTSNCLD